VIATGVAIPDRHAPEELGNTVGNINVPDHRRLQIGVAAIARSNSAPPHLELADPSHAPARGIADWSARKIKPILRTN
jgi:hypothetical protein